MDTMTLNQVRDLLVEKYPGRTVSVHADCWYHRHNGERLTHFLATMFEPGGTAIARRVETAQLCELEAAVAAAMAPQVDEAVVAAEEGGTNQ